MDDPITEYLDNGDIVFTSSSGPRKPKAFATTPRPSPRDPEPGPESPRYNFEELTGIFHIEHKSYDVVLSDARIAWVLVNGQTLASKKKKKKDGANIDVVQKGFISYRDIYACELKKQKSARKGSDGVVVGLSLFTYQRKDANRYVEKELVLEHPSEDMCTKWSNRIQTIISSYASRPRRIKMYVQPYAGKKNGRSLLKEKCEHLFLLAKVDVLIKEIYLPNSLEDDVRKQDFNEFDGVVVVGGDGTVNKVINALLNKVQRDRAIEVKPGFTPARLNTPVAIIPVGTTNHIAQSVLGTDDLTTATFHIIFGNTMPVDMCSVFHQDTFHQWAFNGQYGFGGNILEFTERYNVLGQKRVDAAFLKALTKSKLRPYHCEIQYIPSPCASQSNPLDGVTCRSGCGVCLRVTPGGSRQSSVYTDSLQEYDPLAVSGTSSTIIDLSKESPWRTTKGEYLNVALFTLPAPCEYAPQGLSKYTHLADGCMDLVLVRNVNRKDFIRYLRRHGTSKNQFDMPFVETYRVKEVKFRPRTMSTWRHKDHDFSEIDYQLSRSQSRGLGAISERSLDVVDELSLHGDSDVENDPGDLETESTTRSGSAGSSKASETQSLSSNNNEKDAVRLTNSAPVRRSLESDILNEKRKKRQRQREEKLKAREQMKSRSVWSIDNSVDNNLDLDFRVYPQFLLLFGAGLSPDTPAEEVKLGCLPSF